MPPEGTKAFSLKGVIIKLSFAQCDIYQFVIKMCCFVSQLVCDQIIYHYNTKLVPEIELFIVYPLEVLILNTH
jgi:hypothetical protein